MRIENPQALRQVAETCRCECCNRACPTGAAPHHLFSRGAGRLDIRLILQPLCLDCHRDFHDGKISRAFLLAKRAKKERTTAEAITQVVHWLRALPKNPSKRQVETSIFCWDFSYEGMKLAKRVWEEIG
jgi:hypothetical protein